MRWLEQSRLLVAKAEQDLYMMRAHAEDPHVTDETWGFHAQQAVEKLLKAMLSKRETEYPFTHRLRTLADLLTDPGVDLEARFEPLLDLTPYATELRYYVLPPDSFDAPLDRQDVLALTEALADAVRAMLAQ